MLKNLAVTGGVAAGILLALWFSTVVALGPAPGSLNSPIERQRAQPDQQNAATPPLKKKSEKQPSKEEAYCSAGEKQNECRIALRAAVAAENQAYYALWGVGGLLITLVLSAVASVAATSAARTARKVLTDLERPHVLVEVVKAGLRTENDGSYRLAAGRFEHKCVNYGRTPAALTEYHFEILVPWTGIFPAPIDPMVVRGRELPNGCVASERTPYVEGAAAMKTYPMKLLDARSCETYSIYFMGYIRYRDMIFGARYIAGFCFVYDWIGEKFVRRGDNERYNYTRVERATPRPFANRLKEAAALLWG